jgi:hypothetical protein
LFFNFFSPPLFANSELPGYSNDTIDPPPAAPIDNNLIYIMVICVVFTAYFFYKSYKENLLKDKN